MRGFWTVEHGRAEPLDFGTIEPLMERLSPSQHPDVTFAGFLERHAADFDAGVRAQAVRYVEGLPAGALDAQATLARAVEDTLFFAGEATCAGGMNSTVEGALGSGRRAAREIREALGES